MELKKYLFAGGLSSILLLAACGETEETAEENTEEADASSEESASEEESTEEEHVSTILA